MRKKKVERSDSSKSRWGGDRLVPSAAALIKIRFQEGHEAERGERGAYIH